MNACTHTKYMAKIRICKIQLQFIITIFQAFGSLLNVYIFQVHWGQIFLKKIFFFFLQMERNTEEVLHLKKSV